MTDLAKLAELVGDLDAPLFGANRTEAARILAALAEVARLEKDPSSVLSDHPGCVYCMKAGTTVKDGEVCPKCRDRLPTSRERQYMKERDAAAQHVAKHRPSHDLYDQHFEAATAIAAEGARIGIATCKLCGAAVMLDPRDSVNRARQHYEWHAGRPDGDAVFGSGVREGDSD